MKLSEVVVIDGGDYVGARINPVNFMHNCSQSAQVIAATNSNLHAFVYESLLDVVGTEEKVFLLLLLGYRQGKGHPRIEGH